MKERFFMYKKIILGILCCGFVFSSECSFKKRRGSEKFGYAALCTFADLEIYSLCHSCNKFSAQPYEIFLNDQVELIVFSYCFACHTTTKKPLTDFDKIPSYSAWRKGQLHRPYKGKEHFEQYFEQLQIRINADWAEIFLMKLNWKAPTFASNTEFPVELSQKVIFKKGLEEPKPELEWVKQN